jgi:hypothetical protein
MLMIDRDKMAALGPLDGAKQKIHQSFTGAQGAAKRPNYSAQRKFQPAGAIRKSLIILSFNWPKIRFVSQAGPVFRSRNP